MTNEQKVENVNEATSPVRAEQVTQVTFEDALQQYVAAKSASVQWVHDQEGRKRKFKGWLIGTYDTQWLNGREQSRWREYYLYRREDGTFVLEIQYITCWQGESDSYDYEIYKNWEEVLQKAPPPVIRDVRKTLEEELKVEIPVEEEAIPL